MAEYYRRAELEELSYKQMQALAKAHKVQANGSRSALRQRLLELLECHPDGIPSNTEDAVAVPIAPPTKPSKPRRRGRSPDVDATAKSIRPTKNVPRLEEHATMERAVPTNNVPGPAPQPLKLTRRGFFSYFGSDSGEDEPSTAHATATSCGNNGAIATTSHIKVEDLTLRMESRQKFGALDVDESQPLEADCAALLPEDSQPLPRETTNKPVVLLGKEPHLRAQEHHEADDDDDDCYGSQTPNAKSPRSPLHNYYDRDPSNSPEQSQSQSQWRPYTFGTESQPIYESQLDDPELLKEFLLRRELEAPRPPPTYEPPAHPYSMDFIALLPREVEDLDAETIEKAKGLAVDKAIEVFEMHMERLLGPKGPDALMPTKARTMLMEALGQVWDWGVEAKPAASDAGEGDDAVGEVVRDVSSRPSSPPPVIGKRRRDEDSEVESEEGDDIEAKRARME